MNLSSHARLHQAIHTRIFHEQPAVLIKWNKHDRANSAGNIAPTPRNLTNAMRHMLAVLNVSVERAS